MARLEIVVDTGEYRLLLAELAARVRCIGPMEAERRLGCTIDGEFFARCHMIVVGNAGLRVVPTRMFDEALLALW